MTRARKQAGALVVALAVSFSTAPAQQKDPPSSTPLQPYPPLSAAASTSQAPSDENQTSAAKPEAPSPDTRPLTGAQQFSLGSGHRPLYLLSQFQFRGTADTNPGVLVTTGTQVDSAAQVIGSLALQRQGSGSESAITYAGGASFYNTRSDLNLSFHQVGLLQRLTWRRWELLLADQASYLPESSFGFGGFSSLNNLSLGPGNTGSNTGSFSGPGTNLLPAFIPNQTILTGTARRIANSAVAEAAYHFGPRTVLTATVSYGILRFLEPGFVESNQLVVRTGYNRVLNSRDTLGLVYGLTRFSFEKADSRIENHLIHIAYGRRINGRMALQFTVGPRVRRFANVSQNNQAQVSWSMGAVLSYRRTRNGFSLGYHHGITGGSGVFLGALSDTVQARYVRHLSARWIVNSDFGYARNVGLRETNLGVNNFQFQSSFAGVSLNRPLGRSMNWGLSYRIYRQASENSVCIPSSCGRVFLRHQLGLTFDWSPRSIRIE